MNFKIKRSTIIFLMGYILLFSCKKEVEHKTEKLESSTTNYNQAIVLGKKLENPYSVSNMRKAYSELAKKGSLRTIEDSPVRTTHYYVRFIPKTWEEYDSLLADSTLILYQIPLDYEILEAGNTYHDPSIPENSPTWQYASLKKEQSFTKNIQYEILEELYIPEEDLSLSSTNTNTRTKNQSLADLLVKESLILTNNASDTAQIQNTSTLKTAWSPGGTIRVWDTRLNKYIPLVGVKIRARRWFTTHTATTNASGWYQTNGFKYKPVNYSLVFETDRFDIRSGTFGQVIIDGPKSGDNWNLDLWDGANRFYAHVFRGAYRYHYGNIGGLKRPSQGFKLKYAALDKSGKTQGLNIGSWSFISINPNILIYRFRTGGAEYTSDEVFSTTCHETCHTTHWQIMNADLIQYSQVNTFIGESWPVGVEWYITSLEYRERGISNYGSEAYSNSASYPLDRAYQYWTKSIGSDYTPIFIDLIDTFNQSLVYSSSPNDQVTGYSLSTIESNFLKHVYGLSSLKDQLKKNKPSGVTDTQIDLLLSNY